VSSLYQHDILITGQLGSAAKAFNKHRVIDLSNLHGDVLTQCPS